MEYKLSPQGSNTTTYHMYTDNDTVNILTSDTPKLWLIFRLGPMLCRHQKKKTKKIDGSENHVPNEYSFQLDACWYRECVACL